MVRDTTEGKINFLNVRFGPMFKRWAAHLTKGREKYPDVEIGVPNWTLAEGRAELERARESASRHFEQWLAGDRDEDHAAAVYFNINLAEYVLDKMLDQDALRHGVVAYAGGCCDGGCGPVYTNGRDPGDEHAPGAVFEVDAFESCGRRDAHLSHTWQKKRKTFFCPGRQADAT